VLSFLDAERPMRKVRDMQIRGNTDLQESNAEAVILTVQCGTVMAPSDAILLASWDGGI